MRNGRVTRLRNNSRRAKRLAMEAIHEQQFMATLLLNQNHPISCHFCNKQSLLVDVHNNLWVYRDVIKGFICNDCINGKFANFK